MSRQRSLPALFFIAALLPALFLRGQELHEPSQLLKIAENSNLHYIMDVYKPAEKAKKKPEIPQIVHGFYRVKEGSNLFLRKYTYTKRNKRLFAKAEKAFHNKRPIKARRNYMKILKAMPDNSQIMTYIGQTWEMEKRYDKAITWYRRAIKANIIDYMAHWFLADALYGQGKLKEAVDEITLAHVLNRLHPKILERLKVIYRANHKPYYGWSFHPRYRISRDDKGIHIFADPDTLTYALCRAIWAYEPGYRKKMGVKEGTMAATEDAECLLSYYSAYENISEKERKNERKSVHDVMTQVLDGKALYQFIYYEIWLVKTPMIALNLPEDLLKALVAYVKKYHTTLDLFHIRAPF